MSIFTSRSSDKAQNGQDLRNAFLDGDDALKQHLGKQLTVEEVRETRDEWNETLFHWAARHKRFPSLLETHVKSGEKLTPDDLQDKNVWKESPLDCILATGMRDTLPSFYRALSEQKHTPEEKNAFTKALIDTGNENALYGDDSPFLSVLETAGAINRSTLDHYKKNAPKNWEKENPSSKETLDKIEKRLNISHLNRENKKRQR